MKAVSSKDSRLYKWLYFTFRLGIACSLCLVFFGFILSIITEAEFTSSVVPPDQFFHRISELDPLAIITLGILILVLTPLSSVILAMVTFLKEKDRLYLGISVAILCILLVSLTLAIVE
ncbi:MAG: DUF1634 domain-containing protein [Dehalococcoidales bacterium]